MRKYNKYLSFSYLSEIWCPTFSLMVLFLIVPGLGLISHTLSQNLSPPERLKSLNLDSMTTGRVTAYFVQPDRARAMELALLAEEAAAFYKSELGFSFKFSIAALPPESWFSEFPGMPYAIPWPSIPDRVIFVPSSLTEGVLIREKNELENRHTVDFVMLHEFGHIAAKIYFRPGSDRDYLPVSWFDELLATCFAYTFVHDSDSVWAESEKAKWTNHLKEFVPPVLSLDWDFMNNLPPQELARVYAWYQNLLNLKAADICENNGIKFIEQLKRQLAWNRPNDWTNDYLLAQLEEIAPGFEAWADRLSKGNFSTSRSE